MFRALIKSLVLAALPLGLGLAAGYGFWYFQESCGRLVGPLLSGKCHRIQLEYAIQFQTIGTAVGAVVTFVFLLRGELRRRRAVQQATPTGGPS